jgi:Zn-dependent peptidase ImmA (M78 family)
MYYCRETLICEILRLLGMGTALQTPKILARDVRMKHWNRATTIPLPVDPFVIAQALDVKVTKRPLPSDTAGFILKKPNKKPEITLNSTDHLVRQRFTLAHEIGHLLQRRNDDEIGYVDSRDELASTGAFPEEVWANQFAAELLMPAAVVKKWWAEGRSSEVIQRKLQVSAPAMTNRLKNLGLLNG